MKQVSFKAPRQLSREPFLKANRLWKLLALTLLDLKRAEKMPGCLIKMNTYHREVNHTCEVCLAGAVLINRFYQRPKLKMASMWNSMSNKVKNRCRAIDCLAAATSLPGSRSRMSCHLATLQPAGQ